MPPLTPPLSDLKFTLDSAAVAGFFGGKEAISAMATVHLYKGRRWLGWYNSPGSYTIAKRFGRMANARFWDGLFPGPNDSPAVSFGLDGKKGPEYIAALSGTKMPTGHLAYLTMEKRKELNVVVIEGRVTKTCDVAYLGMNHVNYDKPVKQLSLRDALIGLIPIIASVATCAMCAVFSDWFSFSMIFLGIACSGLASFVIGKGRLVIKSVNNPAKGSPPGHGILKGEEDVVVIKGKERDVNAITKGRFDLETGAKQGDEEKCAAGNYHAIGVCSLLLLGQFLLQLLLIPQATLFGQIMFIISLVVSWVYNSYLSSLEKEKIQSDLLFETLGNPEMHRFRTGTRTTMAVFVCLLLFHGVTCDLPEEEQRKRRVKILNSCLPNDTVVWRLWTEMVVDQLLHINYETESLPYLRLEPDMALPEPDVARPTEDMQLSANERGLGLFKQGLRRSRRSHQFSRQSMRLSEQNMRLFKQNKRLSEQNIRLDEQNTRLSEQIQALPAQEPLPPLSEDDKMLLNKLLDDASAAFRGYFKVYRTLPADSSHPIANGH